MWFASVHRTDSLSNPGTEVIRVHGIGDGARAIKMEILLGTLSLGDPNMLALVQCLEKEGEETARDVARYYAEKLDLEVEI